MDFPCIILANKPYQIGFTLSTDAQQKASIQIVSAHGNVPMSAEKSTQLANPPELPADSQQRSRRVLYRFNAEELLAGAKRYDYFPLVVVRRVAGLEIGHRSDATSGPGCGV